MHKTREIWEVKTDKNERRNFLMQRRTPRPTHLNSTFDATTIQKINKDIEDLSNTINRI